LGRGGGGGARGGGGGRGGGGAGGGGRGGGGGGRRGGGAVAASADGGEGGGGEGGGGGSDSKPYSAPQSAAASPAGAGRRPGALAAAVAAAQQAGTTFCDASFRREVAAGRLSASSLDRYSAAALAGVVAEYLSFGQAEGGVGDVAQLDALFGALGFTPRKAAAQVRWAVLSDAALLRRHEKAHSALADAMQRGESVGACVGVLERCVAEDAALDPGALASAADEGREEGEKEETGEAQGGEGGALDETAAAAAAAANN